MEGVLDSQWFQSQPALPGLCNASLPPEDVFSFCIQQAEFLCLFFFLRVLLKYSQHNELSFFLSFVVHEFKKWVLVIKKCLESAVVGETVVVWMQGAPGSGGHN